MASPYVGEIRVVGFLFAPLGWVACNGQTLRIAEYEVLFTLIGTTYGGDGVQTFQVPNLSGRVAVAAGTGPGRTPYALGEGGGAETVSLTTPQLPIHAHGFSAPLGASSAPGTSDNPVGQLPGSLANAYAGSGSGASLAASALVTTMQPVGGGQPHANLQPSLALNYIICTDGLFPPRP